MKGFSGKNRWVLAFLGAFTLIILVSAAAPQMASAATFTVPLPLNTSRNWSGYVASGTDFTSATGTWIVPTATFAGSGSTEADATWVGIGGLLSHDLIQGGTQAILNNGTGKISYNAWFETLPQTTQSIPVAIVPGDSVTVTLTETTPTEWQFFFRDNMTGQTYSKMLSYNSSLSSVEWVEEMPASGNATLPLDNFGAVTFTNGSAVERGATVTIAAAGAYPLTMTDRAGATLATPSALTSDDAGFTVVRAGIAALPPQPITVRSVKKSTASVAIPRATVAAQIAEVIRQLQALQRQLK